MNSIVNFFNKLRVNRAEERKKRLWFSNYEAARIIREFVSGNQIIDPYAWDDLMSIPHTNPDIMATVELINEFDRRFPDRNTHEYCDPRACPYFTAIADLLEKGLIRINDKSELVFIGNDYSSKMRELVELVENTVLAKR